MEQRSEKLTRQPTKEEIELRLYVAGGRKGKDDPMVKRMLRRYAKPLSDEEMYRIMDKALGDKSILDALNEIR